MAGPSATLAFGPSLLFQHFHFTVPAALLLMFAPAIICWYEGPGRAVLAVASSTSFYWYFVPAIRPTGARGKMAQHPWRHRAVAVAVNAVRGAQVHFITGDRAVA